jgi:hypothetical protein
MLGAALRNNLVEVVAKFFERHDVAKRIRHVRIAGDSALRFSVVVDRRALLFLTGAKPKPVISTSSS